uniref:sn-1-specific diacylglycerol lipase n=1 Tax=Spongospora subterranea TaxID=70186 RepID=A0A0H5QS39_9EUKA|eukprot:CRZ04487.1 hypothetical protein [Spongospora subterranea]
MAVQQRRGLWTTGTAELGAWTICNMVLELPLLVSWTLGLKVVSDAFHDGVQSCDVSSITATAISFIIIMTVIVSVLEFLAHATVLISSIFKHFGESVFVETRPNLLSGLATFLTGLKLILTVLVTFGAMIILPSCPSQELRLIIVILIVSGWIAFAFNFFCYIFMVNRRTTSRTVDDWKTLARCLLCHCCWWGKDRQHDLEDQYFSSIAANLRNVAVDVPPLSISDTFLTLALVRLLQMEIQRLEHVNFSVDTRFSTDLSQCLPFDTTQPQSQFVSSLLRNTQPTLDEADWARLNNAKHYCKYSVGAYGAPLFSLMQPCHLCCLPNFFQDNRHNIRSSGCCFCSIKAFLLRTDRTHSDLIYANLRSQAGTAVFYVCADHEKQTLVVAVRGTHSTQDVVNDLLIDVQLLDEFGFPGSHIHAGVFNAAVNILAEIRISDAVSDFLSKHPTYGVVLTGHSLGAAVSSTMALLTNRIPSLAAWSNRALHCYAYAPLQMTDLNVAESPTSCSMITSIVFKNDIVSRLSLLSVRRLKICMNRVLDLAVAERSNAGINRNAVYQSLRKLHPSLNCITELAKDRTFLDSVNETIRQSPEPKFFAPGRIFHIIEREEANEVPTCCFGQISSRRKRLTLVYPMERVALDEIIVSKSMLLEHFPQSYFNALNKIDIPEMYRASPVEELVAPFIA